MSTPHKCHACKGTCVVWEPEMPPNLAVEPPWQPITWYSDNMSPAICAAYINGDWSMGDNS